MGEISAQPGGAEGGGEAFREMGWKAGEGRFARGFFPAEIRQWAAKYLKGVRANRASRADLLASVQKATLTLPRSLYYSVYEFTEWDPSYTTASGAVLGRSVYNSATLDCIFREIECHGCGVLCPHVIEEVAHLRKWSRDQDLHPLIVYSGAKSAHCYWFFSPVKIPNENKNNAIKKVARSIDVAAVLKYVDAGVGLNCAQMARAPEAVNVATGYRCSILSEADTASVHTVIARAKSGAPDLPALAAFLAREHEPSPGIAAVLAATPPPPAAPPHYSSSEGTPAKVCPTVVGLIENGCPEGMRYYAMLSISDYYRAHGMQEQECVNKLNSWRAHHKMYPRLEKVASIVRDRYHKGKVPYMPCAWLVNVGVRCQHCFGTRKQT